MDIEKFIFLYTNAPFKELTDSAKAGLESILKSLDSDSEITDIRHKAYMLATVYHECAATWLPIEEYGKGKGRKYGVPATETGLIYYGRGFVQLTWDTVYKRVGDSIGVDLYNHPELALDSDVAYKIMSFGMKHGIFTGVRLASFVNDEKCDYINARKIINSLDCADKIAGYAKSFEKILNECA